MPKLINFYKPIGLTPLEVIKQLRITKPELTNKKIGYAGRLDPLAHGVLLLMVGEETKKREKYLGLPKTYEFEVVFGIQTDTYDLLGYVEEKNVKYSKKNVNIFVNTFVNKFIGKQMQAYPPYSSKTVKGKPLFWYARNNKLKNIIIPQREIEIFDFTCVSLGEIAINTLEQKVNDTIKSVAGDFRQEEILERWQEVFSQITNTNLTLPTAKFHLSCSSGTYVRGLVNQLGKELGCGAVALEILRTHVGDYSLQDTQKFVRKSKLWRS